MSGKASSSHSSVSSNRSDGLSHVYIKYPSLRCNISELRDLFYDDGNKLLISPTSDKVFSWKTVPFDPSINPVSDSVSEGPILSIRYSLDGKFVAILRSSEEVQFWHRESGETFTQRCKPESESILGFFWTDCPQCDVIIVKSSGLDLLKYTSESKSVQLVETKKLNVSWYVYTHESRLLLLASGMQCKTFNGFQLSSAGILRLPKFEMVMAKSEANSKPVLAAEDVFIVTVYGRIYCLQVDRVAMILHCYRFYRDAIVQQGSFPIYSSKVAVSVVDNVLLVHQVDAKVVILYDVFADSRAPISAPLPLLLRGFPKSNSSSLRVHKEDSEGSETGGANGHDLRIYGDEWSFVVPDLICDVANQSLWKIHLDLEAISSSSSDVASVLEFLQRRKLDASKAKQLCLSIIRTAILEHRPVSMISKAIDVLVASYSNSVKAVKLEKPSPSGLPRNASPRPSTDISKVNAQMSIKHESTTLSNSDTDDSAANPEPTVSNGKADGKKAIGGEESSAGDVSLNESNAYEQQESQLTSPAVSPDEMYTCVFSPVHEQMIGDPSYLVAIIVEFLRSANSEKVKLEPNVYILIIQLLARGELYTELGLFVINKQIVEPSKEVALQLLESGWNNSHTRKLGLDMLRQLSFHHDYVQYLAQDGYYIEALRYARKHKVITVRPSLFLEAALASKDSQNLSAVLRFFSDFTPGFRTTSDHSAYYRILKEMNSTGAA